MSHAVGSKWSGVILPDMTKNGFISYNTMICSVFFYLYNSELQKITISNCLINDTNRALFINAFIVVFNVVECLQDN